MIIAYSYLYQKTFFLLISKFIIEKKEEKNYHKLLQLYVNFILISYVRIIISFSPFVYHSLFREKNDTTKGSKDKEVNKQKKFFLNIHPFCRLFIKLPLKFDTCFLSSKDQCFEYFSNYYRVIKS